MNEVFLLNKLELGFTRHNGSFDCTEYIVI